MNIEKIKFTGINGATAHINDGYEQHNDGSFTLYATIQSVDTVTYKMRYMDYTIDQATELFKNSLQIELDKHIIGQ